MTEGIHVWAFVTIVEVDEDLARTLALDDQFGRLERAAGVVAEQGPTVVRGPMCSECRVSWWDVHRSTKPWPCPGARPAALGGSLVPPLQHLSRQQRRGKQRQAAKAASAPTPTTRPYTRNPGGPTNG